MNFLKQVFNFYIHFSIHIAFSVISLLQITKINLNLFVNFYFEIFVFFGTIFGYNFLKNFDSIIKNKFDFKNNKLLVFITLTSLYVVYFSFLQLEKPIQKMTFQIGLLVLLYPFLRKIGFLKIFLVGFCFAYLTVYIPSFYGNLRLNDFIFIAIQRFFIITSLTIPFEILDYKKDCFLIKSLPQLFGVNFVKILGFLFLTISILLKTQDFVTILIVIIIGVSIVFVTENLPKNYSLFWVESIPILWWFLYEIQNPF